MGIGIPRLAQFADSVESEATQTKLRNIQTATTTMLSESTAGNITPISDITDVDIVVTTDSPALIPRNYLMRLDTDGKMKTGCRCSFTAYGAITQTIPCVIEIE